MKSGALFSHFSVEKPIISPARTDANSIISPARTDAVYYQSGSSATVRCFVVYPTQTPCFHSVPLVRRLVAGVCGSRVRSSRSPFIAHRQTLAGALIYFLSVHYISGVITTLYYYLIKLLIRLKRRFLCRLGLSVGFLYHLGFRVRVSSGHFCIF